MRISTQLTDKQRDAVKEYAVTHGYTMKRAYTNLILDGLYDRFLMRVHPKTGNVGVKFAGKDNSVVANIGAESLLDCLRQRDGEWVRIYSPRSFALGRAGLGAPDEPLLWDIDGYDDVPEFEESEKIGSV